MNLSFVSIVFTILVSSASSVPGVVQFVPNSPFLFFGEQSRSLSTINPLQLQFSPVFPVALRIIQDPTLTQAQPVLLRTVEQNQPQRNTIIASTRVIQANNVLTTGGNSGTFNRNSNPPQTRVVTNGFRNQDQNDVVVIGGLGGGDENGNTQENVVIEQENEIPVQETPSQSYGYGVPVPAVTRFQPLRNSYGVPTPVRSQQPVNNIRSEYGAPVPVLQTVVRAVNNGNGYSSNVNTVRQQSQVRASRPTVLYEIHRAPFVAELRSVASRGPDVPVAVINRNIGQRNQVRNHNGGYGSSRQSAPRTVVGIRNSVSQSNQLRSQGGYSGASSLRNVPYRNANARVQYYTVRHN